MLVQVREETIRLEEQQQQKKKKIYQKEQKL